MLGKAKEPSAEELARFHAALACDDTEGSIATSMAARATALETEPSGKAYAKAFAAALLDETCKGGKALTAQTRAALRHSRLSARVSVSAGVFARSTSGRTRR